MKRTTSPYITVKNSNIHSTGVFARKDILEGTKIIEYVGERLTKVQSQKRADIPLDRHQKNPNHGAVYLFELNKRYDLDGDVKYNTARFINHSCDPNCESDIIRGKIWVMAIKDIKKGEELSYNYGYGWDNYEDHRCHCGTDRCIGYILAEEHWPKLRRKLKRIKERKLIERSSLKKGKKKVRKEVKKK